jgi:hypothetical protein
LETRALSTASSNTGAEISHFPGGGAAGGLESSMPSHRLEHEAQMLGFLERAFPSPGISSPQHLQIRGFMIIAEESYRVKREELSPPTPN